MTNHLLHDQNLLIVLCILEKKKDYGLFTSHRNYSNDLFLKKIILRSIFCLFCFTYVLLMFFLRFFFIFVFLFCLFFFQAHKNVKKCGK